MLLSPLDQFDLPILFHVPVGTAECVDFSFRSICLFSTYGSFGLLQFGLLCILFLIPNLFVRVSRCFSLAVVWGQSPIRALRDSYFSQGFSKVGEFGLGPLMSLMFAVLFLNGIGLIPMGPSLTSHIYLDLQLSLGVFLMSLWFMHRLYGKFSMSYLRPAEVDPRLGSALFAIELSSLLIRPLSLALRLFANMVAGHILLHIFSSFCVSAYALGFPFFIAIFPSLFLAYSLELLVCFIQAFVFFSLSAIYLVEFSGNFDHSLPFKTFKTEPSHKS